MANGCPTRRLRATGWAPTLPTYREGYAGVARRAVPVAPTISRADFADPALAAFLQAHLDDMEPTAPPESRHALDLGALQHERVRLWVATADDEVVGTAALAAIDDRHEELKSMRTDPALRGTGVASRMLAHVLDRCARARRRAGVARDRQHGLLRAGQEVLHRGRLRAVRAVRVLRRRPEQHLHDDGLLR